AATQDANVRGTVSLSYPLLRSASLDADALALREAALAVDAARRRLEVVRQQARAQVLSALRDAEVAKARLELAQETYAAAVRARAVVDAQVEAGAVTEAQVVAAELELLRAQQELITAERTYNARREQLLRL